MAYIGPSLKWLDQRGWISLSTEDDGFGKKEDSETSESLSPSHLSSQDLSSPSSSLKTHGSSTANDFQNDSIVEKELPQQDDEGCGRPQVSLEDSVNSIRHRRLFSHDTV